MSSVQNLVTIHEVKDTQVLFSDELNEQINASVREFVLSQDEKNQSHEYWAQNRNTDQQKAMRDNLVGKKAEYFAMKHLREVHGFPDCPIDLQKRIGFQKKWVIDLCYNNIDSRFPNVHVKACLPWIKTCFRDYSWTFQFSNANKVGGRDTIFDGPDTDLVAFMLLDDFESPSATVKAIMPWGEVKKHLRDPKKRELKNIKKCSYYQDMV